MNLNWTWHKIGQGQPGVMIYINFVVLQSMMLHTKFQGNWPNGSGERFFKVLSSFGHDGHLSHVTMTVCLSLICFIQNWFHMKYIFHSLVIFWKNGLQIFYQNFSTQMTLAKVTKWPWPQAFISDWLDFISIPKSTITTQKWIILAFPIQMPMEPKLTLP